MHLVFPPLLSHPQALLDANPLMTLGLMGFHFAHSLAFILPFCCLF
uniref:Uncharacterized protein n=1 Tax=Chloracidobacterium thermophilum TaxID=458033 RepID=A8DJV9_9BACT|nr:hypothetical protein YS_M60-F11.202 [Chloracidobacterium thermophilum]